MDENKNKDIINENSEKEVNEKIENVSKPNIDLKEGLDHIEDIECNISNNSFEKENVQPIFANSTQFKPEETNNTSNINDIIINEEIKVERERKIRRIAKGFSKAISAVSCFAFLGIGIGSGYILAKNTVAQYEKDSFSFDNTISEAVSQVSLTSTSIASVFEEVGDSVVNISTMATSRNMVYGSGSGSGIIYKIDGDTVYIITNNHVVEGSSIVTISVTGTEQIQANVVGVDPSSDLAVLSVKKQAMEEVGIENITVAKFADSDQVKVGEFVFPIGNALGEGKTITQGIISSQNKQINIDGTELTVLQTDAAINPGNSGGALINSNGEVVGVNTAKLASYDIEGIGYAIPSNIALQVADDIIENGSVQKPYLGIQGQTITDDIKLIYNLKIDGVLVIYVENGSSAHKAGLVPTDIITSFGGKEIKTIEDLSNAIKEVKVNETVELGIIRNGFQEMTIQVTFSGANNIAY